MPEPMSISQIDSLIDLSYKSREGSPEDRSAFRDKLRATRTEVIKSLDKRPKQLQGADQVLAEISKPKKKFRKAKFGDERVVVCGSTNWTDKVRIRAALKTLVSKDTRCLIIGTSKGAEQLAITVAKELKFSVIQVHPQQHLGTSAVYIRNHEVFRFFKPTRVIAFHNDIETSTSSRIYLKLGAKLAIPSTLVTKHDNVASIAKKMKKVIQ